MIGTIAVDDDFVVAHEFDPEAHVPVVPMGRVDCRRREAEAFAPLNDDAVEAF